MRALFLDDIRTPPNGWTLVRDAVSFIHMVKNEGPWDVLSLDHDLGEGPSTGYGKAPSFDGTYVADWLVRNNFGGNTPKVIYIHSSNPAGADRMYKILRFHTKSLKIDYKSLLKLTKKS